MGALPRYDGHSSWHECVHYLECLEDQAMVVEVQHSMDECYECITYTTCLGVDVMSVLPICHALG